MVTISLRIAHKPGTPMGVFPRLETLHYVNMHRNIRLRAATLAL